MDSSSLDILILTDLHYTSHARHHCPIMERQSSLAPVLAAKALQRLRQEGVEPQLILLLGDLTDNGDAPNAERDLADLAGQILKLGIPTLAVPGNHDNSAAHTAIFGCTPGLYEFGGYGFLLFHDTPGAGENYFRPPERIAWTERIARQNPSLPLVALQHNPLHPGIEARYPYLLDNATEVCQSYTDAGILLSLSGHYHRGQEPHIHNGVGYATTPALAQAPHSFQHLRLEGHSYQLTTHRLRLPIEGLADLHSHTEFAYCATTVKAGTNTLLAEALGLHTQCFTEHAFHLYFPRETAWNYKWQTDPSLVEKAWADPRRGRMTAYRAFAAAQRSDRVKVGLEVDLLPGGEILHPSDLDGWDLLVGAIHAVDGKLWKGDMEQSELEALFMRDLETLLSHPIQILAHPFRIFSRAGLGKPQHLYPVVARELAAAGVAAEINFHTNQPEATFIRACLEAGTLLSLGSDAHAVEEVGDFHLHLKLLREAGLELEDIAPRLYNPFNTD